MLSNPTIANYFSTTDMERQHKMQKAFLTKLAGGPDLYIGRDLVSSHEHLDIKNEDFNTSKEYLEEAMVELNVEKDLRDQLVDAFESGRTSCVGKFLQKELIEKDSKKCPFSSQPIKNPHENDKKVIPLSNSKSIYERIGGEAAISAAVELFYQKQTTDIRVRGYFKGIDLSKLHCNQKAFLAKVFGGPDNYKGRDLKSGHAALNIPNGHFDAVAENLIETLHDLKVPQELIDEIKVIVESTRKDCVSFEPDAIANNCKKKISLYEQIGGEAAASRIVDRFYQIMLDDSRVKGFFSNVNMERLSQHQKYFITKVLGGPDNYTGRDLKCSHEGLHITHEHFNITVDNFLIALKELGYKQDIIKELTVILESTRSDCVYSPSPRKLNISQNSSNANASLFDRMGGQFGISKVVELFYHKQTTDPRVKGYFKGINLARLKQMQNQFLAKVSGGPDQYKGRDLPSSHQSLKLPNCHYDAVKENLLNSCQELGLPQDVVGEISRVIESVRNLCVYPPFVLMDKIFQENRETDKIIFEKILEKKEQLKSFLNTPQNVERTHVLLCDLLSLSNESRKEFCGTYFVQVPNKSHLETLKNIISEGFLISHLNEATLINVRERLNLVSLELLELVTNISENIQKLLREAKK